MSKQESAIVDAQGQPFRQASARIHNHRGADIGGRKMGGWNTQLMSGDGALLGEHKQLMARTEDLIRNHGLMSGAVQIHLDNVIGKGLKLSAQPDLGMLGLDPDFKREFQQQVQPKFNCWAQDPDNWIDSRRSFSFSGLLAQAYRSYLVQFEILAMDDWQKNRPSACYNTAIMMIDPGRLENPQGEPNSHRLRNGVLKDARGLAPVGYHISTNMAGDPETLGRGRLKRSSYRPRYSRWGRKLVHHAFDPDKIGQSRGRNGLVSALVKSKELNDYDQATIEAATINAMYAAHITSPLDWASVREGLDGGPPQPGADSDPLLKYITDRDEYHADGNIMFNGSQLAHLFPGEKLEFTNPNHPTSNYSSFTEATLRHIAGGFNLSYEQLARDYSKTNYSSARASMLEAHRFFDGKRQEIASQFANWIYSLWLEEAFNRGDIKLPKGAPSFYDAKAAWCRAMWIGPPKGHVDPMKEISAIALEMGINLTTLEKEAAARGEFWEDTIKQRAVEYAFINKMAKAYDVEPGLLLGRMADLQQDPKNQNPTPVEVQE